jgi:hypothetical protein
VTPAWLREKKKNNNNNNNNILFPLILLPTQKTDVLEKYFYFSII